MAFGAGSLVMNKGALTMGVPALIGTIAAVGGSGAGYWNVLWEGGAYSLDVPEAALYDYSGATLCSFRPAGRKAATNVYPAGNTAGMVVLQDAVGCVIRTTTGYQYYLTVAQVEYFDRQ